MLALGGSGVSAYGTIMQGNETADALNARRYTDLLSSQYQAQSLRYARDTALAGSQRQAQGAIQDKDLALSKAQAVAAASGGGAGAGDTSVGNIMAGIDKQGEYNKAMALFEGETKARELDNEATNAQIAGVNDFNANGYQQGQIKRNAKLSAAGTILGGAASAGSMLSRSDKLKNWFG